MLRYDCQKLVMHKDRRIKTIDGINTLVDWRHALNICW